MQMGRESIRLKQWWMNHLLTTKNYMVSIYDIDMVAESTQHSTNQNGDGYIEMDIIL